MSLGAHLGGRFGKNVKGILLFHPCNRCCGAAVTAALPKSGYRVLASFARQADSTVLLDCDETGSYLGKRSRGVAAGA